MKKLLVLAALSSQVLFASAAQADRVGVVIGDGGFSIGIGIGDGRGHGGGHHRPRPRGWVCTAQNARGMTFEARGYDRYQAENRALDRCYSYGSRRCFVRPSSCSPVWGGGRW